MKNPWQPYQPNDEHPWELNRVVHLHRRLGFGATWHDVQRSFQVGPQKTIDRFLNGSARGEGVPDDFEQMSAVIGDAAVGSNNPNRLKAWWLYRMLFSPDPLAERLTLMWHNHFATSNLKVDELSLMRQQNETFREYATAPFGELFSRVVKGPAILTWLDGPSNRKGHPNENLAREAMELFSLGIGNYTEDDVKQAARALTGWSVVRGEFRFKAGDHDEDEKLILNQRGKWNGDDLVKILVEHAATANRLSWRLADTFLGENVVDDTELEQLAEGLRARKLDISWALETMLRSQAFFSNENLDSQAIDPVGLVTSCVRTLELFERPPSTLILAEWVAKLGQDLFYPPNVGGWTGGKSWLSSRTIVSRANFAATLASGKLASPPRSPKLSDLLEKHNIEARLPQAVAFLAKLLIGGVSKNSLDEIIAAVKKNSVGIDEQLRLSLALLLARPEAHLV